MTGMPLSKGRATHFSALGTVLLLSLATVSAMGMTLGAAPAAHAVKPPSPGCGGDLVPICSVITITTSNGASVCPDSLNGEWDQVNDACTITYTGSTTFSGESWSDLFELLHTLLDIVIPDPSYALYIPQFTILNVGDGVQVTVISDAQFGIVNGGTINNNGTITAHNGGVIATASILNSGTINNNNVIMGDDDDSPFGIMNGGAINNNYGSSLSGSNSAAFNSAATGIFNSGVINNVGELFGQGSSGWVGYTATAGQGIYNDGTINNLGSAMPHDFYIGMFALSANPLLVDGNYGIYNDIGTINDYCHPPWSYDSYSGAPQNFISCNSYQLEVDGLSTALAVAAEAGSFVSWEPFVIPGYVGLGPNGWPQAIYNGMATGPMTYSFPYNVSGYTCQSGCYGTVTLSNDTSNSFVVTYSPPLAAPTISVSQTTIDSGQSATLPISSPFSDGTPPYTCQLLEEVGAGGFSDFGSSFPCSPETPSRSTGALMPGSYSFELQVTDGSHPAQVVTSNAVAVTVLSPNAVTQQLLNTVNGMRLPGVTTAHLDPELSAALNSIDGGNTNAAISQLNGFVHYVNTHTTRKISTAQAQQLITDAQATIFSICFCA